MLAIPLVSIALPSFVRHAKQMYDFVIFRGQRVVRMSFDVHSYGRPAYAVPFPSEASSNEVT